MVCKIVPFEIPISTVSLVTTPINNLTPSLCSFYPAAFQSRSKVLENNQLSQNTCQLQSHRNRYHGIATVETTALGPSLESQLAAGSPVSLLRQDDISPAAESQSDPGAESGQLCVLVWRNGQLCAEARHWDSRSREEVSNSMLASLPCYEIVEKSAR